MKLTQKHFEIFKEYCLEYQKQFDLMGWKLAFEFKPLDGSHAAVIFDLEASQATIALTNDYTDKVTPFSLKVLKNTAKHEMFHVLLGRLGELSQYRYVMARELIAAEHEIVTKLMNLI